MTAHQHDGVPGGTPPSPPADAAGGGDAGAAVLGLEGGRPPAGVRRFSHEAMATVFEVHVVHPDARYAAQAAQAAFALVDRLEGELSRFRPNSDIARINHLAAGAHTRVSPSTLECLVIARHMFDLTGGAFDISIGSGLPSLEFDPDRCTVRATADGVRLDLGGIGKGYAVDGMADLLDEWGIASALVHGGFSSVLALDAPPGADGWELTLSDPGSASRVLARRAVRQAALGASGLRKGQHIIDPRTGVAAQGRVAAWVALARPALAESETGTRLAVTAVTDALATACMLLDEPEIDALCAQGPGLEAWVLPAPGADGAAADLRHFA